MNQARVALNKLPPKVSIKILHKVFELPTPAARKILKDFTKPRKSHKSWIHKVPWNNEWTGCWIGENVRKLDKASLMNRINDADIIFFYVHGGGFRVGSSTMYMDTYIQWIKILKHNYGMEAMIMSVDYRLAPECKYPGPVEDVVRAYEHLVRTLNIDAGKIIVAGDCAGATLVLEMLFITHDPSMFEIVIDKQVEDTPTLTELPRPAGAVFSSPIVTDETDSSSWKTNVKYDYISQNTARIIKRDYFEPLGPDSPPDANQILGIAKLETGFKAFLPDQVLMFLGNKEVLRDDSLDLATKAEHDGVEWETFIEDCVHDWFVIREVVKDKKMLMRADMAFADFCYRAVRHVRRSTPRTPMRSLDQLRMMYENNNSSSDYSSMRRSSEGLEMVVEEDEPIYDFDDFEEEDSFSDTDLDSAFAMSSSNNSTTKQQFTTKEEKPRTVFV